MSGAGPATDVVLLALGTAVERYTPSVVFRVMGMDPVAGVVAEVVEALAADVARFQELDLEALSAEETMGLVREVEVVRRRLDAATAALAGHLDASGKHLVDGHRTAKAALVHVGRLSGAEAFGRVRTARVLKGLPAVADAYGEGAIPTEGVRAIARMASNPRIQPVINAEVDKIIAALAVEADHATLVGWLRDFEALADEDGAAARSEACHRRRRATFAPRAPPSPHRRELGVIPTAQSWRDSRSVRTWLAKPSVSFTS